jgi:hypothetical protein
MQRRIRAIQERERLGEADLSEADLTDGDTAEGARHTD